MQTLLSEDRAKLNLSENLKRLMKLRAVTQCQIAKEANISQPFVSKMANGEVLPNAAAVKNVAEALGVTSDDLLNDPPTAEKKSA